MDEKQGMQSRVRRKGSGYLDLRGRRIQRKMHGGRQKALQGNEGWVLLRRHPFFSFLREMRRLTGHIGKK
jgi:hypothetical protein